MIDDETQKKSKGGIFAQFSAKAPPPPPVGLREALLGRRSVVTTNAKDDDMGGSSSSRSIPPPATPPTTTIEKFFLARFRKKIKALDADAEDIAAVFGADAVEFATRSKRRWM